MPGGGRRTQGSGTRHPHPDQPPRARPRNRRECRGGACRRSAPPPAERSRLLPAAPLPDEAPARRAREPPHSAAIDSADPARRRARLGHVAPVLQPPLLRGAMAPGPGRVLHRLVLADGSRPAHRLLGVARPPCPHGAGQAPLASPGAGETASGELPSAAALRARGLLQRARAPDARGRRKAPYWRGGVAHRSRPQTLPAPVLDAARLGWVTAAPALLRPLDRRQGCSHRYRSPGLPEAAGRFREGPADHRGSGAPGVRGAPSHPRS